MKTSIREFALRLGVDDVGFASVDDYDSPRSPKINEIFPGARTIIVMAVQELSHGESPSPQLMTNGRLDTMEFGRYCCFRLGKYLEKTYQCRAMTVPPNYPLDMGPQRMGLIGEVSLRHAAVAAGLGVWGRHNLVVHPRLGSRVLYYAVLTDLEIAPDPPLTDEICTNCNICVESCPVGALDKEGFTDVVKCLKTTQPFGLSRAISFWKKFVENQSDEQKAMILSETFMNIYHVQSFGMHYVCYKCYTSCPIGQ